MDKRILILLTILAIAVGYSLTSLHTADGIDIHKNLADAKADLTYEQTNHQVDYQAAASRRSDTENGENVRLEKPINKAQQNTSDSQPSQLPYVFNLVGISEQRSGQQSLAENERKILVQFENELFEHTLNDYLLNTNMQLVDIRSQQISIRIDDTLYTKRLSPPNLLSASFKIKEKSYSELMQMSPQEIGTRPRIIEHLFDLTSTPYIADGKLVGRGLNPKLFEQAGFHEDDVLKAINGKSVTIEAELETIKNELRLAQTLKFLVMRKGRLITLYLDIPSEALELVRE